MMHNVAFEEFAAQFVLIPGQKLNAREALNAIGLHKALNPSIDQLFESNDLIHHDHLVLTERDPLLVQWNPFSGCTPLLTDYALGVTGYADHRWLQSIHEAAIKALYHQIHECVHAQWAAFGLSGGLAVLSHHQRAQFHSLAEASAVYIGDIEGPELLCAAEIFKEFFQSFHRSLFQLAYSLSADGELFAQRFQCVGFLG